MWKRRDPSEPEPVEEAEQPRQAASSTPAPPRATEAVVSDAVVPEVTVQGGDQQQEDDPYAQLENFFNEPLVLEDIPVPPTGSAQAPPPQPQATAGLSETVQRLEEFGRRLASRFEALEANVQEGSAQTLEALRRLGERMGAELAMLDKRAVNLELTMARLRATTEALELSLRKLPDLSGSEPSASEANEPASPDPVPAPPSASSLAPPTDEPESEAAPHARADALFTLEEEVPPTEWDDDPPLEDPPPPDPTWP